MRSSPVVIPDPNEVFRELTTAHPVRLQELPREHGIYALHDHTGTIRYIGITKDKLGFYGRIHNRHATGSKGRSHKFSHAYNTGRMWCEKGDGRPDAQAAKSLRNAFIREHCRATFVVTTKALFDELGQLEKAVQAIAPAGMLDWGNKREFVSLSEPKELVDDFIDQMSYSIEEQAAFERQASLYASMSYKGA